MGEKFLPKLFVDDDDDYDGIWAPFRWRWERHLNLFAGLLLCKRLSEISLKLEH